MGRQAGEANPLVGCVGVLLIGCRGASGPGEVEVSIRGGREHFIAYADEALPAGSSVLIVEARPARAVGVVAWHDPVRPTV